MFLYILGLHKISGQLTDECSEIRVHLFMNLYKLFKIHTNIIMDIHFDHYNSE